MGPIYLLATVGALAAVFAALDVKYGWTGRYRLDVAKHAHGSPHISATRELAAGDLIRRLQREYGSTAREWLYARTLARLERVHVITWSPLDDSTREVPVIGVPA